MNDHGFNPPFKVLYIYLSSLLIPDIALLFSVCLERIPSFIEMA